MLKGYLVIAFRSLRRHPGYAFVNLSSLAVGMATTVLIGLFIQHEYRYDRHHTKIDRVSRIVRATTEASGQVLYHPGSPGLMAPTLEQTFPEVERAARVWWRSDVHIRRGDEGYVQTLVVADPQLLQILDLPLVEGHFDIGRSGIDGILLTSQMARKFFGETSPIGHTLHIDHRYFRGAYVVTGVMADAPRTSSFRFDFLTTAPPKEHFGWWDQWGDFREDPVMAFVLLRPGASRLGLEQKLSVLVEQNHAPEYVDRIRYHLQPLSAVHLHSRKVFGLIGYGDIHDYGVEMHGDIAFVHFVAGIGLLILLVASVSYTNLATAQAYRRSREMNIRKLVGAHGRQLVVQSFIEAGLLALAATVAAWVLVRLSLPAFNSLIGRQLTVEWPEVALFVCLTAAIGLLCGFLPTPVMARLQAASRERSSAPIGNRVRNGLMIFQFAVSVALMTGALIVREQLQYAHNIDAGFDSEQVIVLPLFDADRSLTANYQGVKAAFEAHPRVLGASASQTLMGFRAFNEGVRVYPEGKEDQHWRFYHLGVDEDFTDLFEIRLLSGLPLSGRGGDGSGTWLLNETAARQLGWSDPVGKILRTHPMGPALMVRGVVEDFHIHSIHREQAPVFLFEWPEKYDLLSLKISAGEIAEMLAFFEETWRTFLPDRAFEFHLYDAELDRLYRAERRTQNVVTVLSVMAVLISGLGLYGLATYTIEQRTRETAIRKVLGASPAGLGTRVAAEFGGLILVASVLPAPIVFVMARIWLDDFAYRIDLTIGQFAVPCLFALGLMVVTIGYHTIRAEIQDPTIALRDE